MFLVMLRMKFLIKKYIFSLKFRVIYYIIYVYGERYHSLVDFLNTATAPSSGLG